MKKLFWMGGSTSNDDPDIPQDAHQRLAYVLAENEDEAIEKARELGIDADAGNYTKCDEVAHPGFVPESFVGRLLSPTDLDELHRLSAAAEVERLSRAGLKRELTKIYYVLDEIVVGLNRQDHGLPPQTTLK